MEEAGRGAEQQRGAGRADAGGRAERGGRLGAPGEGAVFAQQRGVPGDPGGGQLLHDPPLVLDAEAGDRPERAGRVVVQREPVHLLVGPPGTGEDHDGAAAEAQQLPRPPGVLVPLAGRVEGFGEGDLAQRARPVREDAQLVEQQGEGGAGLRCGGGAGRAEGERAEPSEQVDPAVVGGLAVQGERLGVGAPADGPGGGPCGGRGGGRLGERGGDRPEVRHDVPGVRAVPGVAEAGGARQDGADRVAQFVVTAVLRAVRGGQRPGSGPGGRDGLGLRDEAGGPV